MRYDGVTGTDKPLLADPTQPGDSQLPAGVVQINRENYMMVTTAKDLRPQSSRLVKADPAQGNWPTLPDSERDARIRGRQAVARSAGTTTRFPTADSHTGWVYIVANNFDRTGPRGSVPRKARDLHRPGSWQGWSVSLGWGQAADAAVAGLGRRDEHPADRRQDGAVVLQRQHRQHGGAGGRRPDRPGHRAGHHRRLRNASGRIRPSTLPPPEDNRLAQPYGGYISPGSTLDEVRVFVSQWNTMPRGEAPYRVIQFAVNPFKP